ncbi:MAG: hypothetical protein COV33_00755 [Candidatus Zambryskibacteria bacterium CG10_big_fil_rev_8_21_14_0_10_34_34]|uniref:Transcriptional repressor PaaX-like central Cas2-like domain-containing protein n=1 Tax=Candidatus Zambryskibacteria bacterium CG10_big_fil_rev_8_21_14_0_10_34_34 TaxID=1975114 RepID=A0A2H0R161_9BACT|nr:MAG: hypothetical protein COV33_00755 [Candidatus Zambryskibacteria bacterium CG10_big_fil_rev_8_21_14_0_10_34_34]
MKKESLEQRSKKSNIKRLILQSVGLVGMVGVAAVAPNVIWAMKKIGLVPHYRQEESIEMSRKNLIKRGYLEIKNGKVKLTRKGRLYLLKHTGYKNIKIKKPKWDHKWRVLIFDIPEKIRFTRDNVRLALLSIGFVRLQDSVWVYPYNCEDIITLLKEDLEIGKDLLYMIVDTIENDKELKKHFGLR